GIRIRRILPPRPFITRIMELIKDATQFAADALQLEEMGVGTVAETGESVVSPIASHPQRDGREAEKKGQDRQEVEESPTKDCEFRMSHELQILSSQTNGSSVP